MADPSHYIDPVALQAAILEARNEEVGAALLLLATRIVRSRPLPPGLDPDDVIATAVLECLLKLGRLDHSRGPRAMFNWLSGSCLLCVKNMSKLESSRNSRRGPMPNESERHRHTYE